METKKRRGRPKKEVLKDEAVVEKPLTETSYKITLRLGEQVIEGYGATALEAVQSMPVPIKIFTKGFLVMTDGKRKVERTWLPPHIKRLFQPLSQKIQAKNLDILMK